ncbi:MAG: hypothetical protein HZB25_14465 [Candidatus Eisenbacteria bacterium]|nr:hypothetical protein [Candidatus Eisenbacteria bacterium]
MAAKRLLPAALLLLAVFVLSCGSSEITAPPKDEITGTWNATKVEYAATGSSARVDLVSAGGTATLALRADSTFQYSVTPAGGAPAVINGRWLVGTDILTLTPSGSPWSWAWSVTLAADTLRLTGANAEYDFDSDTVMEAAKWNLAFVRTTR